MQKYAFLDRDGTIIYEPERDEDGVARSLSGPEEVRFLEGAIAGMRELIKQDYLLVLATNQDYLGTEFNPSNVFEEVTEYMLSELKKNGITFEYLMICPHGPHDGCNCRKPKTGGLDKFLLDRKVNIDLPNSIMFGDRDTDRQFAHNLGVKYVQIETNKQFVLPKV